MALGALQGAERFWSCQWELSLQRGGAGLGGRGGARGTGQARGPGGEGGVSRWKEALWGNFPGWSAGEIRG